MKKSVGAPKNNKNAVKIPKALRKPRSFKASDDEYEVIKTNAENAKMSVSEFIRYKTIINK